MDSHPSASTSIALADAASVALRAAARREDLFYAFTDSRRELAARRPEATADWHIAFASGTVVEVRPAPPPTPSEVSRVEAAAARRVRPCQGHAAAAAAHAARLAAWRGEGIVPAAEAAQQLRAASPESVEFARSVDALLDAHAAAHPWDAEALSAASLATRRLARAAGDYRVRAVNRHTRVARGVAFGVVEFYPDVCVLSGRTEGTPISTIVPNSADAADAPRAPPPARCEYNDADAAYAADLLCPRPVFAIPPFGGRAIVLAADPGPGCVGDDAPPLGASLRQGARRIFECGCVLTGARDSDDDSDGDGDGDADDGGDGDGDDGDGSGDVDGSGDDSDD